MYYNTNEVKKLYKIVNMDKKRHREGRKVSADIRREIIKELNPTAYVLYEYYVEKVEAPEFDLFNDKIIGQVLGLSERTVREYRNKLEKAGFIRLYRKKLGDIEAHDYFIGKDKVLEHSLMLESAETP